MVKVIKGPKRWSYRCDCKGCGAALEAGLKDVEWAYFGGGYCERGDKRYYIACPVCGTDCIIPDEQVTPLVELKAKEYRGGGSLW